MLRVSIIRCGFMACAAAAILGVGGCKQEVQFTRIPVLGVIDPDLRPNETSIHLAVPVEFAGVTSIVEQALGDSIRSRDLVDDIACDRRKSNSIECNDAIVVSELTRNGPVEFVVEGLTLALKIPFHYVVAAKGQGWAAYLSDSKSGSVTATVPLELALGAGFRLDARMVSEIGWSERSVPVLRGKAVFARVADAKIKSLLKAAIEPIRQAVAAQPIRDATESAWRALHEPIELGRAPDLWLRTLPERVSGGGFAEEDGGLIYRVRIDARVGLHRGAKPPALFEKPMHEPQRSGARNNTAARDGPSGTTTLRLPIEIPAKALADAVIKAFPKDDVIETRADTKSPNVKVRASKVELVPAREKLALALQLDVVEPQRLFGLTGKAYLVGRPVLDPATGVLQVLDIGFPPTAAREAQGPPGLKIGEEPFAGRFAMAARLDIGATVQELLPRFNARIDQPLGKDMTIRGHFDGINVASIEPTDGGLRANVMLSGTLSLRYASKRAGSFKPTSGPTSGPIGGPTGWPASGSAEGAVRLVP